MPTSFADFMRQIAKFYSPRAATLR